MAYGNVYPLPDTDATFNAGSGRVWVYYPEGLLPRRQNSQAEPVSDVWFSFLRGCRLGELSQERQRQENAATYPGDALLQESFHVCTVKDFGDAPGVRDIYVEMIVDSSCGLAFAEVSSSKNAMNATDLLQRRALPFYERHGVTIACVFTRSSREYCGLPPVHPFETILATSRIEHRTIRPSEGMRNQPCEVFYHVLRKEFFTPAIRNNSYMSFSKLQQDLNIFVENYNHERPCFNHSPQGLTPFDLFLGAIGVAKDRKPLAEKRGSSVSRSGLK